MWILIEMLPAPKPPAPDSASWRAIKSEEGVSLRIAPTADPRAFWGEAVGEIAKPLDAVIAHVIDFQGAKKFIPRVAEIRELHRGTDEAVVYYRFDLPWPVSDRDWTVRYRYGRPTPSSFEMVWSEANDLGPPPGKAVRVQVARGFWLLTATDHGTTQARYVFMTEFGGHLPRSVAEQTAWRQPLATIQGVRKALGVGK